MKTLLLILTTFLFTASSFAQNEIFIKSGTAISGYDPVAYFKESKPVIGQKAFTYEWKGANWYFSNAQNLADFKRDPEKYSPQFGGYCAYGMAEGHKAPTSPDAWTILDEKLYLNYNKDVQQIWNKDREGNIQKAIQNWPTIKTDKD